MGGKGKEKTKKIPKARTSERERRPKAAATPLAARRRAADPVDFPVVGIGASAGGLAAFTELLSALPASPGMAFVVVSHLAPEHESALAELLAKATPMPVRQARDGDRLQRDHVYVGPPGQDLNLYDGVLRTSRPNGPIAVPSAIDHFFASLARDQHMRARGVLLSGSGNDGTEGLRLIRMAGGVSFAQDPRSARFDAMPRSAIAADAADFVLKPAVIARKLVEVGRHGLAAPTAAEGPELGPLVKILELVRKSGGMDFRHYKHSTLQRRIARRMAVRGCASTERYLEHLRTDAEEVRTLQADLLIHVSSFMRDAEAFRALQRQVLEPLTRRAPDAGPIRVWVPGCARGEEVYTIGMLLLELLPAGKRRPRIQLFGTDISGPEIDAARLAHYPKQALTALDARLRARYFDKVAEGYRVCRELRGLCVFAVQEVGSDPPFSNIDVISCRNTLIYFERPLQRRVIEMFHYALRPGGSLFLGRSESLAGHTDLFGALDAKHRIFRRKEFGKGSNMHWARAPLRRPAQPVVLLPPPPTPAQDLAQHIQQLMLERYAPAGFYIDEDLEIRAFVGDVGSFVQPTPGQANLQLMSMLPASMALDLRTIVRAAAKSKKLVSRETHWIARNGRSMALNLVARRAAAADGNPPGYIVLLERVANPEPPAGDAEKNPRERTELGRLSKQLMATREQLQTVIEEQERTGEELRAANEEALSSNEELQSNNEELETAKEELQSANEELATVNEELQTRNQELDLLAGELSSLIAGVNIPIVHLDSKGCIHRFSPAAQAAFNLIPTDIGRAFSQIKPTFKLLDLDGLVATALRQGTPADREVQDASGHWFELRIRPFQSVPRHIEGVLIALVDIDASKRRSAAVVETISEPLLVLDPKFRVVSTNPAFLRAFQVDAEDTEGVVLFELGDRQWDTPELRRLLKELLPRHQRIDNYRVEHVFPKIGRRVFLVNAEQITDSTPEGRTILIAFTDVTERESEAMRLNEAREHEARGLARELHDVTGASLAAIAIDLARIQQEIEGGSAGAAHGLGAVRRRVQAVAEGVLALARRVHPSALEEFGLVKTLRSECEAFAEIQGIVVQFGATGPVRRLPKPVQSCLYRIVQEALRNVGRHARARRAEVRLEVRAQEVELRVHDDGIGFEVGRKRGSGLGLLAMTERVNEVGGSLIIESKPRQGTTVRVAVPLRRQPDAAPEAKRAVATPARKPARAAPGRKAAAKRR